MTDECKKIRTSRHVTATVIGHSFAFVLEAIKRFSFVYPVWNQFTIFASNVEIVGWVKRCVTLAARTAFSRNFQWTLGTTDVQAPTHRLLALADGGSALGPVDWIGFESRQDAACYRRAVFWWRLTHPTPTWRHGRSSADPPPSLYSQRKRQLICASVPELEMCNCSWIGPSVTRSKPSPPSGERLSRPPTIFGATNTSH